MDKVKCTICEQSFDKDDPLYKICTTKHDEFHNPDFKGGNRDDNFYKLEPKPRRRNMIYGVPEYK